MHLADVENCTGCGSCVLSCPNNCISMSYDSEGFAYPQVNNDLCVDCSKCTKACHALNIPKISHCSKSWYGWHKDKDIRFSSSSGGAFAAIAQKVLDNGGIVFGAYFNSEKRIVEFSDTDNVTLKQLQKSKYVEAQTDDVFKRVKDALNGDRIVLLCGTPCQVSGLYSFLGNRPLNLLTCDFVCHGVPSQKMFSEHLNTVVGSENINSIDFRPKSYGWTGDYSRLVVSTPNKEYSREYRFDSYYAGFEFASAFMRKSCYDCEYYHRHVSDITLADFWRYAKINPKMNDEKGISLVVSNSLKGEKAVESLDDIFNLNEMSNDYSEYIYSRRNYNGYKAVRNQFYKNYEKLGFEKAAKATYFNSGRVKLLLSRTKKLIKNTVKK